MRGHEMHMSVCRAYSCWRLQHRPGELGRQLAQPLYAILRIKIISAIPDKGHCLVISMAIQKGVKKGLSICMNHLDITWLHRSDR
jgi:hypothetical protein